MIGKRIRELRTGREKTQEDLGKILGVGKTTISQYESESRRPDTDTLGRLADYFGVTTDYLLGRAEQAGETAPAAALASDSTSVPILGSIRAGVPILAEENWDGEVDVPASLKADFALRVSGDSMSWAGIHDGDIAVMRSTDSASPGMIVAAGVEDTTWEATLKYYIKENGHAYLRAANPEYSDIPFNGSYKVIGYTVSVLKEPPPYQAYRQLLLRKDLTDKKWQLAMEIAQVHGLDGEKVANLITLFGETVKRVR